MSGMLSNRKHWRCLHYRLLWLRSCLPAVVLLGLTIATSYCPTVTADPLQRHYSHHRLHHKNDSHNSSNTNSTQAVEMATRDRLTPQHTQGVQAASLGEKELSQCPNCVLFNNEKYDRDSLRNTNNNNNNIGDSIRLEAIKRQILSKLGLKTKPNVTSPVPREVVLATLYRAGETKAAPLIQQQDSTAPHQSTEQGTIPPTARPGDSEPDDFYGRTSEIITFAEPGFTLNGQTLLEFSHFQDLDGNGSGSELRVKDATLWVRVDFRATLPRAFRHSRPDRNLTLWLFKVTQLPSQQHLSGKEFDEYTEMAASLPVTLSALGWLKFDLTLTVRGWYSSGAASRERLRLLVDCSGCGDQVEAVMFRQSTVSSIRLDQVTEPPSDFERPKDTKDTQRPFLVVHTDPSATRRVRRRALDCTGAEKGQCCKQQFYVSFKQLGWEDWIIAPSGYYANYCRGDCGGIHRTPDTFLNYYTHVIEEYRKMDRLSGMQPCCAPLKFSSMSLIYFGPDSNIIKRDLPKMVVDECGCP